jgi:two-component system, NtrC family, sensor kinase
VVNNPIGKRKSEFLSTMKIPFSITFKLLLFILPLVFLPIAIVGYLSYYASVERVSRLSRDEQMLQAEVAAAKINNIFQSCRTDLETIVRFPVITDYYLSMMYGLEKEIEPSRKKIEKLFRDFIVRSPYYYQIRFLDRDNREVVKVSADGTESRVSVHRTHSFFQHTRRTGKESLYISEITYSASRDGFVIHIAKLLESIMEKFAGSVVIDLDYDKVIDLVETIRVGEQGYAFMVDQLGRTIAHPQFKPYEYNLSKYPDPRLREFIIDMMAGETGWERYYYLGENAAAYAPIPAMNWSLAVSISIEEFKREAKAIRTRIIQIVVATLFLVGLVVSVLSHNLLRPVRRLVIATERIAGGDLSQEIPVKSRDELGILTGSFNRMIVNLRDTQNELIRSGKLVALGRLSAGVAHEIRNPLNAMKGAIVHLKRRRPDDPLIQEYTQLILEEISRLNLFVTDFLYLARQSPPNPVPANINEMIRNIFTLFEEKLREKAISVAMSLDPSMPLLQIDPHQMEQVIVNLLINAMDAMSEGGNLEVSTTINRDDRQAVSRAKALIIIKDDGAGISREDLQNAFDPFFSNKEGGTGLGLPISLGIVESHGGLLNIRSRDDKGTTVIIELPMSEKHMAEEIEYEKEDLNRG